MITDNPRTGTASFGSTSSSLLDRVKSRDPDAWTRLVDLYGPLVFDWCRSAGLQSADAADVFQEVFRSVFTGIESFRYERPGDTFRGWLRTICRNKIHDHFRRKQSHPEAVGGTDAQIRLGEVSDSNPSPSALSDSQVQKSCRQPRG